MPEDKFNKFTERARKVLSLAHEEARRFNHSYIGTEHLLLGLVREGDGVAAKVLNNFGVQLPKVRSAVEFTIGRGESMVVGEIGLTPHARKVIELAADEARRLNHHYIGTEHLLLGLLRVPEGVACGVLESLGVNLKQVRDQVLKVASQPYRPQSSEASAEMPERFDQFTERARKVLSLAHEEARRLNQGYVGTEHLLLGLIREGDGVAAKVLSNMGVQLPQVRDAIEHILGHGTKPVTGEIWLSSRTRKSIELAVDEARRLNQHYVGTEHLLLGILREGEGIAAGVLESVGVNLERARQQVLLAISRSSGYQVHSSSRSVSYRPEEAGQAQDRVRRLLALIGESSVGSRITPHDVYHILREMTSPHREVLIMHGLAGLRLIEISLMLEKPFAEVDANLKEAVEDFRPRYQELTRRHKAMDRLASIIMNVCPRFNVGSGSDRPITATYRRTAEENPDQIEQQIQRVYNVLCTWLLPKGVPEEPSEDDPIKIENGPGATKSISISRDLLTTIQ